MSGPEMHSIISTARDRLSARRVPRVKKHLIDVAVQAGGVRSIADLGGVWGVEGAYLFHAMDAHGLDRGLMVDTHPTEAFTTSLASYPNVGFLQGNFGEERVADQVRGFDAVLLFDVLLHQVAPDWDQVIAMYAERVACLVIFNHMWIRDPETVRLLELGRSEYLSAVPDLPSQTAALDQLDRIHPDHGRPLRDVHHIWQWGIAVGDLEEAAKRSGLRAVYSHPPIPAPGLSDFTQCGWVFTRL